MKAKFTVDYFIKKFSRIPARLWTTKEFERGKKHCALGHCGADYRTSTDMGCALVKHFKETFGTWSSLISVNDGNHIQFQQRTPKARILAALKWIKEKQK